jgi:hypothetical protein
MLHFLQYWKAINFTEGETLEHSASSQFERVSRDDGKIDRSEQVLET